MRLQLSIPDADGEHFHAGWAARLLLNGEDVSKWVSKVVVTADAAGGPVCAEITLYATDIELDLPVVVRSVLSDAEPQPRFGGTVRA